MFNQDRTLYQLNTKDIETNKRKSDPYNLKRYLENFSDKWMTYKANKCWENKIKYYLLSGFLVPMDLVRIYCPIVFGLGTWWCLYFYCRLDQSRPPLCSSLTGFYDGFYNNKYVYVDLFILVNRLRLLS